MWNFVFFARRQITDACLFALFFTRGDHIDPVNLECSEGSFKSKLKVLEPFLIKKQKKIKNRFYIKERTIAIIDLIRVAAVASNLLSNSSW
jgi:hypothetical protein